MTMPMQRLVVRLLNRIHVLNKAVARAESTAKRLVFFKERALVVSALEDLLAELHAIDAEVNEARKEVDGQLREIEGSDHAA